MSYLTHLLAAILAHLHILHSALHIEGRTRVGRISDSFGETPGARAAKTGFLIIALVIAAMFVFFALRRLFAKLVAKGEAETLFLQLADAHNLPKRDRDLLQEVALGMNEGYFRAADPNVPPQDTLAAPQAAVFVRKSLFKQAIAQEASAERRERLKTLFQKLFA